jgi:hypothetical protein
MTSNELGMLRTLHGAGSLMAVSRQLSKYKLNLVRCRRSDGRAVAPNLKENTHFSMGSGMRDVD